MPIDILKKEKINMSIVQEMFKIKLKTLLETERDFEYPEYMRLIRKTIGFSRRFVSEHVGCSETKIVYLEKGDYGTRGPDYEFVITIANFYGLNSAQMLKKFRKYMKDRRLRISSDLQEDTNTDSKILESNQLRISVA